MMSLCSRCGTVVRVVGDARQITMLVGMDSDFWPNGYVCPVCNGAAVGVETGQETPEMLSGQVGDTLLELSPEEAFALYMGLGTPKERACTLATVAQVLHEGVVDWQLEEDTQTGRIYIAWMETAQGTRLYLGAGPHGAVVYRVRPKQSYTEKVQDAQVGAAVQP